MDWKKFNMQEKGRQYLDIFCSRQQDCLMFISISVLHRLKVNNVDLSQLSCVHFSFMSNKEENEFVCSIKHRQNKWKNFISTFFSWKSNQKNTWTITNFLHQISEMFAFFCKEKLFSEWFCVIHVKFTQLSVSDVCKLLWLIGNEISGSYQKWWLKKQHLFNHNCYLFYILWLWQGLIHCTMWYDTNSVHIWLFDCGMVRLCVKWKWMKGRIKSVVKSDRSFICICVYLHMVILFTANKRAYTHTPTHEYTHS